jgi:hypothetical protein
MTQNSFMNYELVKIRQEMDHDVWWGFSFIEYDLFNDAVSKEHEVIPVICRGGPWGYEVSRFPYVLESRLTDGGKILSLTHQAIPIRVRGGL